MKDIRRTVFATVVVAVVSILGVVRAAEAPRAATSPIDATAPKTWVDVAAEETFNQQMVAKATERGEALLKRAKWGVRFPFQMGGVKGGVGEWTFYDAGELVICSRNTESLAVNKATGEQVWLMSETKIKAVAAGANGAEMVVMRSQRTPGLMGGSSANIEMLGVGDRVSKWLTQSEPNASMFLIGPKHVFAGAVVPRAFADGPRGSWTMPVARSGSVAAYDRQTGEKQWSYILTNGTLSTRSLSFANGVLYVEAVPFSTSNNPPCTLIALNGANGKPVFVSPLGEFVSPLAVKDDLLIASSQSGVVAFDAKTGQEKWRERIWLWNEGEKRMLTRQAALDSAPAVLGDTLFVSTLGFTSDAPQRPQRVNGHAFNVTLGLAAFDFKEHQQTWFFRPPANGVLLGVNFEKGKIVASATERSYFGVDAKAVKLDWLMPLDLSQPDRNHVVMPTFLCDGVLYMIKDDKLMAVPLEGI